MRQVRQSSPAEDFNGKLNLRMGRRLLQLWNGGGGFLGRSAFLSTNPKTKGGNRRMGPWIIIGGFGEIYALVHFRGSYLEVGLEDMRAPNRILYVVGRGGALQLHLPIAKFHLRHLVEPQTLISFLENGERNYEP